MDMVNTTELGELLFGTGKPDISYAGLAHFSSRTSVLIDQVHHHRVERVGAQLHLDFAAVLLTICSPGLGCKSG
jgi:hypothetical protein